MTRVTYDWTEIQARDMATPKIQFPSDCKINLSRVDPTSNIAEKQGTVL